MHRLARPVALALATGPALVAGPVLAGPLPPTFPPIGEQRVAPGATVSFRVAPTDPDGSVPGVFLAAGPPGATLEDNGDGTRTFRWTAPVDASGREPVRLVAVDAEDALRRTSLDLGIVVGPRPGTDESLGLEARDAYRVRAGEALDARLVPTDSTRRVPSLSALGLPRGASLPDNGDGTRSLRWLPGEADVGSTVVTLVVRAADDPSRELRRTVEIVVPPGDADPPGEGPGTGDPDAPRLVLPAGVAVTAGETVAFTVSATMPGARVASLNALAPPPGSSFADRGDGTRRFVWSTAGVAPGPVALAFRATDPATGASAEGEVAVRVLAAGGAGPGDGPGDGAPGAGIVVDGPVASLAFEGARLSPAFAPDVDRYRLDAGFLQPSLVPVVDGAALAPVAVPVGTSTLRVRSTADGRTRTIDVRRGSAGDFVQTALLGASSFEVALVGDTLVAGDDLGARVFERGDDGEWRYRTSLGACRDRAIGFDGTRVVLAARGESFPGFGCDAADAAAVAV